MVSVGRGIGRAGCERRTWLVCGGAGVPGVPARRVQARRVRVSLRASAAARGRARRRLCHGVHGRRQGPLRPRPLPLFPPSPAPAGAP